MPKKRVFGERKKSGFRPCKGYRKKLDEKRLKKRLSTEGGKARAKDRKDNAVDLPLSVGISEHTMIINIPETPSLINKKDEETDQSAINFDVEVVDKSKESCLSTESSLSHQPSVSSQTVSPQQDDDSSTVFDADTIVPDEVPSSIISSSSSSSPQSFTSELLRRIK